MRAVLLAAGQGRRLGRGIPKCLLEVGGKTLLERHLEALEGFDLTVVVGYRRELILDRLPRGVEVRVNERYREGSILSAACGTPEEPFILMDADVVYDPELVARLADAPDPVAFLLDPRSSFTGEEMVLGVRGGCVLKIGRGLKGSWDLAGETVGFTKIAVPEEFRRAIEDVGDPKAEYEAALDLLVKRVPAGYVIADRPWMEIDFPEDLRRAVELHR
jgi:choline kinase